MTDDRGTGVRKITNDDVIAAALELGMVYNRHVYKGGGRKPAALCPAGLHDMDVHGVQIYKQKPDGRSVKNGRFCAECKRTRQRAPGAPPRLASRQPRREIPDVTGLIVAPVPFVGPRLPWMGVCPECEYVTKRGKSARAVDRTLRRHYLKQHVPAVAGD